MKKKIKVMPVFGRGKIATIELIVVDTDHDYHLVPDGCVQIGESQEIYINVYDVKETDKRIISLQKERAESIRRIVQIDEEMGR